MLAIDTETTGIDHYHGAKPFLVTTCDEEGVTRFYEWDVDPLTREPIVPQEDLREIAALLDSADRIVAQNGKFDAHALETLGLQWPWEKVEDTLIASHLLASNRPHDLTSLAIEYLSVDIGPLEERLKVAVNECRKTVRQARLRVSKGQGDVFDEELAAWRIAEEGLPEMPSAKGGSKKDKKGVESESPWKFDCWLPLVMAKQKALADCHPWRTVCAEYANADSATTLSLWHVLEAEMEKRGLTAIYREKLKNLPVLFDLESRGVTVLGGELHSMREEYRADVTECEAVCRGVAEGMGYDLQMPKSGLNNSLRTFCFGNGEHRWLNLPKIKMTEGGQPSLDKDVIAEYEKTLTGTRRVFVEHLSRGRKRAKSCDFLDSYEVFGIPGASDGVLVLHPSVNPTATATTRMSMSNPNLQQVSRQESQCQRCLGEGCDACDGSGQDLRSVRLCFGPAPGREWWAMDAEGIEPRMLAYGSGEAKLIALCERPNDPPFYGSQHLLNFSIVYDDLWEQELSKQMEKKDHIKTCKRTAEAYHFTKCGGLAMNYQCGQITADRTFRRPGYRKIKESQPAVEAMNAKWVRHAEKKGWVETFPDRDVCPERGYPLLCARDFRNSISPTVPLNYVIQGSAGWWMVRASNKCHARLTEWRDSGFDAFIALLVHDEAVFDMPASFIRKNGEPSNLGRARELAALMRSCGDSMGVPTPVAINWCPKNWAEGMHFKA